VNKDADWPTWKFVLMVVTMPIWMLGALFVCVAPVMLAYWLGGLIHPWVGVIAAFVVMALAADWIRQHGGEDTDSYRGAGTIGPF
jgi:hypothetical protein